jgi:hypothetical protein
VATVKLGARPLWGLLAVWGLLACAFPVFAQDSGSIRGLVTSSGGDPLPNVAVAVVPLGLPTARHDATTDELGRFEQAGLPPGHYTVSAETDALGSQIFRILVQAGGAAARPASRMK